MEICDTHCHLIDPAFADDLDGVIARALEARVERMVLACCDEKELDPILQLSACHPGHLYPTAGIHPENMADDTDAQLAALQTAELQASTNGQRIWAIGEIGLDLHWDKSRLDDQKRLLTRQLEWALDLDLPVLLHIRDAMPEFIDLMREFEQQHFDHNFGQNLGQNLDRDLDQNFGQNFDQKRQEHPYGKRLRGILHCYSGTTDEAIEVQQYGDFLIGVGGTLTYRKSLVPDVARAVGLDRIVLETDAPYLAPVPHRGHRNEPAYTAVTCSALADVLGLPLEEVAETTSRNAARLFGF